MKAIRVHEFGNPEVMRLEDVAEPVSGPGQILVEVRAAGVNPVDCYIRSGAYPARPALPYTPGMDGAGVAVSVGQGVTRVKAGDRVYFSGTATGSYAAKALCAETRVFSLPDKIPFAQGAGVGIPYGTAYRALFQRAQAVPGEVVLVHGASGGVGLAAVQFARAAGMRVIGTSGTEEGRRSVDQQGAHHVLDHHDPALPGHILGITEGRGVDVVLEMLANVNLGKDLTLLAHGGRVVIIGSRGTAEINPRDAMSRDAAVLGMAMLAVSDRELATIHAAVGAGLDSGTLRPVIGKQISLAEAAKAHHEVMEPHVSGKIVLFP